MGKDEHRRTQCCKLCRVRHLKCDDLDPKCSSCALSGSECVRKCTIRFRHTTKPSVATSHSAHSTSKKSKFQFRADQKWLRSSQRVRFIDETQEVQDIYGNEDEPEIGHQATETIPVEERHEDSAHHEASADFPSHSTSVSPYLEETHYRDLDIVSARHENGASTFPESTGLQSAAINCFANLDGIHAEEIPSSDPPYSVDIESPLFPLKDEQEVLLMRHYIDHMCRWFDLCDINNQHFAIEVPRRAITCRTLLNAIFAISSRHLSMTGKFDEFASDRYHQECLKRLATIAGDDVSIMNDDLLAATILLRTLEELDVPLVGADYQGHLLGIQVFMNAQEPSWISSGLRQASFWVGLRQEIYIAFVNERPVKMNLEHSFIDQSLTPADDNTWSNRIIVNCAKVTQFCFSQDDTQLHNYEELEEYDRKWQESRPVSFLPVSSRPPDPSRGEVFPEITYLNHAVVIGILHGIFARVLLMCHNPKFPRIGPGHRKALRQMEEEIKSQIKELCGIAISNRRTIPGMFTASMGITMCGDRFTEFTEQKALLDVLKKTESDHAWPTATAQTHLKRAWGWEDED